MSGTAAAPFIYTAVLGPAAGARHRVRAALISLSRRTVDRTVQRVAAGGRSGSTAGASDRERAFEATLGVTWRWPRWSRSWSSCTERTRPESGAVRGQRWTDRRRDDGDDVYRHESSPARMTWRRRARVGRRSPACGPANAEPASDQADCRGVGCAESSSASSGRMSHWIAPTRSSRASTVSEHYRTATDDPGSSLGGRRYEAHQRVSASGEWRLRSDVTVGPLVDAWGFGPPGRASAVPDAQALQRRAPGAGRRRLAGSLTSLHRRCGSDRADVRRRPRQAIAKRVRRRCRGGAAR